MNKRAAIDIFKNKVSVLKNVKISAKISEGFYETEDYFLNKEIVQSTEAWMPGTYVSIKDGLIIGRSTGLSVPTKIYEV